MPMNFPRVTTSSILIGCNPNITWKVSLALPAITCTNWGSQHAFPNQGIRLSTMFPLSHQSNNNLAHSIHSFANCVGCHMPRIARSAESGDLHSHVFVALLPQDTLKNPVIPNSCQTCHKHKNQDLQELQKNYEALAVLPKPVGPIQPITYKHSEK